MNVWTLDGIVNATIFNVRFNSVIQHVGDSVIKDDFAIPIDLFKCIINKWSFITFGYKQVLLGRAWGPYVWDVHEATSLLTG